MAKTETGVDLKSYKFPEIGIALQADPILLDESKKRGFYNGNTPHNRLFSKLFFQGGSLKFKKDLNGDFKKKAVPYLKAFMGSWTPRHEEKEAICAMLLSELVES